MTPNEAMFRVTMIGSFIKTKGARDGAGFRKILQVNRDRLVLQHYKLNSVNGRLELLPYSSEVLLDKVTHLFTFEDIAAEKESRPSGLQKITIGADLAVQRGDLAFDIKALTYTTMRGTHVERYKLVKVKKKK